MKSHEYVNLAELREKHFGYRLDAAAQFSGLPLDRFRAIETGAEPPTVFELDRLSRLYGLDDDTLASPPITIDASSSIELLPLAQDFRPIADATKFGIVATARAVRDLADLRRILDVPGEMASRPTLPLLKSARAGEQPYRQGAQYARELRRSLHLRGPIASVRDLVTTSFPQVTLLHAHLGTDDDLAGLTFADLKNGCVIVLNLDGRNESAAARRFSLLHEFCHVLVDWNRMQPLAVLSQYRDDAKLEVERRANGFAARFLCPEETARHLAEKHGPAGAARCLIDEWGFHYGAARLYLRNVAGVELPLWPSPDMLASASHWERAEEPQGLAAFPLREVPPERRTAVAHHAALAYSRDLISRDRFASMLDVTPAAPIERVLGFFALDPPGPAEGGDD